MSTLAGLLGAASVIAWIGTVVDIGRALNGESWGTAIGSGVLAIVLSALGAVVRNAAAAREKRRIAQTLEDAIEASPSLSDELDYLASPSYRQVPRAPMPHPMPVDAIGSFLLVLSWIFMIGGIALAAIGLLFAPSLTMIAFGIVLLLLVGPLHAGQKSRYATHVLRVYERQMLEESPTEPSYDLRIALWTVAQSLARPGRDRDEHVGHMIEAYVELVGAWSADQR